jgi:hypothetical protein
VSPSDEGDTSVEKNEQPQSDFDFSKVNPEDFVCFGTIEEGHTECEQCPFKVQCAERAEVQSK